MSASAPGVRPFTWDQLDALHALLAARVSAPYGATAETLRAQLALPGCAPERDVYLAFDGPRLLGYAWLRPEPAIARGVGEVWVQADDSATPTKQTLLGMLRDRAQALALPEVHIRVDEQERALVELLVAAGYTPVRRFATMTRHDLAAPNLTNEACPAIRVRPFGMPGDLERLTEVQNETFAGSFGFAPNTPEQIAAYLQLRGGPVGVQLADDGGGVVGYVWTSTSTAGLRPTGRIEMMGVRTTHRGRGLGARLLANGFAQLHAANVGDVYLDVDLENAAALNLYERHDFVRTAASTWYGLALSSPVS